MDSCIGREISLTEQQSVVFNALLQATKIPEDIEYSSLGVPLEVSDAIYRCGIPILFVTPIKKGPLSEYISNSTGLDIGEDLIGKYIGKFRKAGYHVNHGPRGAFVSATQLDGIGILNPYEFCQIPGGSDGIDYNLKLLGRLVQNLIVSKGGKYRFVFNNTTEVAGALSLVNKGVINFGREPSAAQGPLVGKFFQENGLPFVSAVDRDAAYNYRRYRLKFADKASSGTLSWVLPLLDRAMTLSIEALIQIDTDSE